ncbi:hypothetical protein GCM10020221_29400 [Streptomyces thioluteus]|uniref:Uncharacterized protein n=1 Tax=Streptomyces thioluteus TaxID=66431 RepID=A0ABN3X1C1_STRTU
MMSEPVIESVSGGVLRLTRARFVPVCSALVLHRGGRAVPHRCGHREVLREHMPDLTDDVCIIQPQLPIRAALRGYTLSPAMGDATGTVPAEWPCVRGYTLPCKMRA